MKWDLSFLTEEELIEHVTATIKKYGEKLEPYSLKKFNNNIVDPIKLIFDKTVYSSSWDEIIKNEIFRQRDKSNNNDIGYFHQKIFKYIAGCRIPEGGWDIIFSTGSDIHLPDGDTVKNIYVEMKNKHNTMNSSSSSKTYMKMQSQILDDDESACFLVEAIAKRSQNIKWTACVDKKQMQHKRIRRLSLDQFYYIVTGESDAFYKLCLVLPSIIEKVVNELEVIKTPKDTVFEELISKTDTGNIAFILSVYMLGFSSYNGFKG